MALSKMNSILLCLVWEMTLSEGEEWYLLKCDSVYYIIYIPSFGEMQHSSSGLQIALLLATIILSWIWRFQIPPKRRYICTILHGVLNQRSSYSCLRFPQSKFVILVKCVCGLWLKLKSMNKGNIDKRKERKTAKLRKRVLTYSMEQSPSWEANQ